MKKVVTMLLGASCLTLGACDVQKTKDGKMPDVDVNVSEGQLPEFNVTGPEVNVGTKNETVEVPTVDVKLPKDKE